MPEGAFNHGGTEGTEKKNNREGAETPRFFFSLRLLVFAVNLFSVSPWCSKNYPQDCLIVAVFILKNP